MLPIATVILISLHFLLWYRWSLKSNNGTVVYRGNLRRADDVSEEVVGVEGKITKCNKHNVSRKWWLGLKTSKYYNMSRIKIDPWMNGLGKPPTRHNLIYIYHHDLIRGVGLSKNFERDQTPTSNWLVSGHCYLVRQSLALAKHKVLIFLKKKNIKSERSQIYKKLYWCKVDDVIKHPLKWFNYINKNNENLPPPPPPPNKGDVDVHVGPTGFFLNMHIMCSCFHIQL